VKDGVCVTHGARVKRCCARGVRIRLLRGVFVLGMERSGERIVCMRVN